MTHRTTFFLSGIRIILHITDPCLIIAMMNRPFLALEKFLVRILAIWVTKVTSAFHKWTRKTSASFTQCYCNAIFERSTIGSTLS